MIFKIADGREYFYQWDIDRQIIVSDPTITEVHFCNRTDVCSLVVEVVDGVANVPNKLLQSGFNVRVFGYDGKATMHEATFEVKARTQPTDYVYTETEIKRYSDLEKRIEEMEASTNDRIEGAVNSYLEENPIKMDGYASKEYVDYADATLQLLLTQHNHDDYYASKNHTHSNYTTKDYVDNAVKNVEVDLTDYAKKTDIPDVSGFITSIPSEYVTETELEAKKYVQSSALNAYAKTNHTHSTADVDGLQKALNEKATQADIDKAIELHDHRYDYAPIEHSHGDEYAAKSHVHSYNSLLDKPTIPSVEGLATETYVDVAIKNIKFPETDLTGYATESYVKQAIEEAELGGEDVDLSNYATKADLNGKADKVHTHTEYAPKTHYHNQYLTTHQDISHLATKDQLSRYVDKSLLATLRAEDKVEYKKYVDDAIADIEIPEGGDVDLSNYYTKAEVDDAIAAIEFPEDDCHVYVDESNSFEDITAAIEADKLPVYRHVAEGSVYTLPLAFSTDTAYTFSASTNISAGQYAESITCSLSNGATTWSAKTTTRMQPKIQVNSSATGTVPKLKNIVVDNKTYYVPETDLTNYYTKDETTQAIQNAFNAIGVAEGGAY